MFLKIHCEFYIITHGADMPMIFISLHFFHVITRWQITKVQIMICSILTAQRETRY